MSAEATPFAPPVSGPAERILWWCVGSAVRASLLISPRPAALLVRRVFAADGAKTAAVLDRHAPAGVTALADQPYGDDPDMLLDIYRPATASGPLPLLLWVHGGGFVGGSKEELAGYFRLIASNGYTVAGPRYSLAPGHRYPVPLRQMMQALGYLQANAERLLIDPGRIALAGDSAGAHIAAQLGAMVTTPGYADAVGVAPAITAAQLRGLILACGPYDLGLAHQANSAAGRHFIEIVLRAYSGKRRFLDDPFFETWSVTENVTPAFPPALITVGNADPLRPHSELLAGKLRECGVDLQTLFYPGDRRPPLGHEYQFDLDADAGQLFLRCLLAFLRQRLVSSSQP